MLSHTYWVKQQIEPKNQIKSIQSSNALKLRITKQLRNIKKKQYKFSPYPHSCILTRKDKLRNHATLQKVIYDRGAHPQDDGTLLTHRHPP